MEENMKPANQAVIQCLNGLKVRTFRFKVGITRQTLPRRQRGSALKEEPNRSSFSARRNSRWWACMAEATVKLNGKAVFREAKASGLGALCGILRG
jgi:hypothetical protein